MIRISVIVILLLIFISCKKTETPVKEAIVEPVLPENVYTKYDGLFCSTKNYGKTANTYTVTGMQTYAYFSGTSIINEAYNAGNLQDIGDVWVDNIRFKHKSGTSVFYYTDTTNTQHIFPVKWKTSGSSKLDSLTFTNDKPYPILNNIKLPDTVRVGKELRLNYGKAENCSLIRLFIYQGSQVLYLNKFYPGKDTSLVVTADEMKTFIPSSSGFIALTFYNDNLWNINGKTINFRNSCAISSSPIILVP